MQLNIHPDKLQFVDISSLDLPSDTKGNKKVQNELLEYCHKLYGPKRQKIIPPLYSARNGNDINHFVNILYKTLLFALVFGYMRPSKLQTALTVYQIEYGRVAYKLLKSAYDVKNSN